MKYLDQLLTQKRATDIWKLVALLAGLVIGVESLAVVLLAYELAANFSRVEYILAPGISSFTRVRPGTLPSFYIEEAFLFVTAKLNAFSYETVRDNYDYLFKNFYAHALTERSRANLAALNYFNDIRARKLVSMWKVIPSKSHFHWCGKVAARSEIKGVACGLVTGEQKLFANHSIPVSEKTVSYLIYAINVAPTDKNFFALEVTRIREGNYETLKAELEDSLANGVMPEDKSA